jgi:hypothetical protein
MPPFICVNPVYYVTSDHSYAATSNVRFILAKAKKEQWGVNCTINSRVNVAISSETLNSSSVMHPKLYVRCRRLNPDVFRKNSGARHTQLHCLLLAC